MNFSQSSALVIVDSTVDHYEHLIQGIQPGAEVIVLDTAQDGVEQLTRAMADRTQINSLHIVSHGRSGEIHLGAIVLNVQTLKQYQQQIKDWTKALTADAEILLYGCEVAAGEVGRQFVQQISHLTGVSVAASTTLTGSAVQGGNWQLEYATRGTRDTRQNPRHSSPLAFRSQTLAAYPAVLAVLLTETFRNDDVTEKKWKFGTGTGTGTTSANPFLTARSTAAPSANGGLPGAGTVIDSQGNGALRLTGTANNQAAFVVYDRPLDDSQGLTITFDSYAYGGSPLQGSNGDGISFFLIDGNSNITSVGAYGGSLGYAQKLAQGLPGITGGYLGVGYDEFGNFSTSLEGPDLQRPTPAGVATPVRDSIAVRGSAASGYAFLGGTSTLGIGVDNPTATTRDPAQRRTRIDLSPTGVLTVRVDLNSDGDFLDPGEVVINNLNVTPTNGALPSTLKLGFAGSTGAATNIHEVRNLTVRTYVPPETVVPPEPPTIVDPSPITPICITGRNMRGDSNNNTLVGGNQANRMVGFAGDDRIRGRGCSDRIDGGLGNDWVSGGDDNDIINGQQSNDRLLGDKGNDLIQGGLGNDTMYGGRGSDTIEGGRGNDLISGDTGNNVLRGGLNNDTISGGRDADFIDGNNGNDILTGGNGNDTLQGGLGTDKLDGGAGNDLIVGGRGRDTLTGGAGRDQFVYNATTDAGDTITDFRVGQGTIVLTSLFAQPGYTASNRFKTYVKLSRSGSNTIVSFDGNGNKAGGFLDLVTVLGVRPSSLTASSFVL